MGTTAWTDPVFSLDRGRPVGRIRSVPVVLIALTVGFWGLCFGTVIAAPVKQLSAPSTGSKAILPVPVLQTLPEPSGTAATAETPAPGHETEAQTVGKCLEDLHSRDPEVRRRAVLILGKYRVVAAMQALVNCLDDPSTAVRQAALVSLAESRAMPPGAGRKIIRLLADPDIHIRRIASSTLRLCFMPASLVIRGGAPVILSRSAQPPLTAGLKSTLNEALRKPDPIVRKNLLTLGSSLGRYLDPAAVRACLDDPDREVRVLALGLCARLMPKKELRGVLFPAAETGDPAVRKAAVRLLPRLLPDSLEVLRKLATDPDPGVRGEAVRFLAGTRNPAVFPAIQAFLEDKRVPVADRAKVVPVLILWPPVVVPCLTKLAASAPPPLRAQAIRALGGLGRRGKRGGEAPIPLALFLKQLDSHSSEVRKAAAQALLGRAAELRAGDISALDRSKFADVRLLAIRVLGHLPGKAAAAVLSDLILDDDLAVRCSAIREMARRRLGDWQFVLAQSLRDPDEEVGKAAADALLARRDTVTRKLLTDFLREEPNAALSGYIRKRLAPERSRQVRPSVLSPLRKPGTAAPMPHR